MRISGGKLIGIKAIADEEGKFRIMGVGAQDTLRKLLAQFTGQTPQKIRFQDITTCKKSVIEVLSYQFSAVSTDPMYGYPSSVKYLSGHIGLILSVEKRGYQFAEEESKERKTELLPDWSVGKAKRAGADAIKLIIYYRKEASKQVREHQRSIARDIGNECKRYDIPYILEIMSYPLKICEKHGCI